MNATGRDPLLASSILILGLLFLGADVARAQASRPSTQPTGHARWEKEIAAFEAKDRESPPPKGGIVFTGSSTIRRWSTLQQDFPQAQVLNRGFGGSEIADATYFADRIIFPYQPKMVFLRAGGNDIHAGKSARQVADDFKAFADKVHAKLPDTTIVYISMAPAPSRWSERDSNKQANERIRQYVEEHPEYLKYVETYDTTITPDGKPREELFVQDRLHFNEQGYKLLADRVRPFVSQ